MPASDFRVTQSVTTRRVLGNLNQNLAKLVDLQDKISSGKELRRPSDSPVGVISALRLRGDVRRNEQITRNLDDAAAWLRTADDALNSGVDQLMRVRDLAIQAKNASLDANARDAIGDEIERIRDTMVGIANSRYVDRPVFGGTTAGAQAYDVDGVYIGESGAIERTVAPGVRVQVNVNGDAVFGPAGANLFNVMNDLAASVRAGTLTDIDTGIQSLDARRTGIQNALSEVGARSRRIETMQEANTASSLTLRQQLSDVEDVDLTKALMEMRMQETAYQAALETTARVIQPTLVDFLR